MTSPPAGAPRTPYVGLVPYSEDDADFFFGREREARIVAGNLRASRLTILYGPSGVGKTSLLHAGVLHELRRQARATAARAERAPFGVCAFARWRDDPLPALAETIRQAAVAALDNDVELAPWTPLEPLAVALERWTEHVRTLLVVLDQFEEYFLYHPEEDGSGTFAGEFPAIVNEPNLRVHFLLSIREDAWAKLDRFEGEIPQLFANYIRVDHLGRAAARAAIERPIAEWNDRLRSGEEPYTIEDALVEAVLAAAAGGTLRPGEAEAPAAERPAEGIEAPFLQLVMERLWRETVTAGSRELSLATLERLGGAEQIVENHLLEALGALTPGDQAAAADVFRYLVTRSKTKIAHSASDLAEWTKRPETEVAAVLERLVQAESGRILRRVPPPPGSDGAMRYELFHDVLAEPILEWRSDYERERERRAALRRLARVGGSLLLLAAVFAALGILALVQRAEARRATSLATSLALAATAERELDAGRLENALPLGLEAYRESSSAELASSLVRGLALARSSGADAILRGFRDGVRAVAFAPGGRTLATAAFDGRIQLWDAAARRRLGGPLRGHTSEVWSVAFSADGRTLASASKDGTVRLWDVARRAPLGRPLQPEIGDVLAVALSRDGRTLALAGDIGAVQLWDVQTRRPLGRLDGHTARVAGLALSPDGRLLASAADDRTVRLWDVDRRRPLAVLGRHPAQAVSVAFSPDGGTLASSSLDGSIRFWDVERRRPSGGPLRPGAGQIWSVAFSPDGATLASSGFDDTVRLWDVATRRQLGEVLAGHVDGVVAVAFSRGGTLASAGYDGAVRLWSTRGRRPLGYPLGSHERAVKGVAFAPSGRLVASVGDDRTVGLWNARTGQQVARFVSETDAFESVAFSPDGRLLAAASGDHTVWLWEVASRRLVGRLEGHEDAVAHVAFGADGRLLASAANDGTVRVWNVERRRPEGEPLRGHGTFILGLAFSPDGRTLASAGDEGTVRLWDLRERREGGEILSRGGAPSSSLAFAPDGRTLAVGSAVGSVRLWDVEAREAVGQPLQVGETGVESLAFSRDGKTLAGGIGDSTVRLWDVEALKALGRPLRAGDGAVFGVAFSPEGPVFASGGQDGAVRLWEGILWDDVADLRTLVCRLVGGNLTPSEWSGLAPGVDYRTTCPR